MRGSFLSLSVLILSTLMLVSCNRGKGGGTLIGGGIPFIEDPNDLTLVTDLGDDRENKGTGVFFADTSKQVTAADGSQVNIDGIFVTQNGALGDANGNSLSNDLVKNFLNQLRLSSVLFRNLDVVGMTTDKDRTTLFILVALTRLAQPDISGARPQEIEPLLFSMPIREGQPIYSEIKSHELQNLPAPTGANFPLLCGMMRLTDDAQKILLSSSDELFKVVRTPLVNNLSANRGFAASGEAYIFEKKYSSVPRNEKIVELFPGPNAHLYMVFERLITNFILDDSSNSFVVGDQRLRADDEWGGGEFDFETNRFLASTSTGKVYFSLPNSLDIENIFQLRNQGVAPVSDIVFTKPFALASSFGICGLKCRAPTISKLTVQCRDFVNAFPISFDDILSNGNATETVGPVPEGCCNTGVAP